MQLIPNKKGNGYIITGLNKDSNKEKIILKAIKECLYHDVGKNISISIKENEIIINLYDNDKYIENYQLRKKRHK